MDGVISINIKMFLAKIMANVKYFVCLLDECAILVVDNEFG